MKYVLVTKIVGVLMTLVVGLYACSGGSGGGGGEEPPTDKPGGDGDTMPDTRALYKDLGVSKIYQFKMPFHVIGARYVPLFADDREPDPPIEPKENLSSEACSIRNELHSAADNIIYRGQLFCRLEKVSGLKVGVKYNINMKSDDPDFPPDLKYTVQLWADDSKLASDGYVTVHKCENEVLKNVVRFKTKGEGRYLAASYDIDKSTYEIANQPVTATKHQKVLFDINYTEPGLTKISMRHNYLRLENEAKTDQHSRVLFLAVKEQGISKIATVEANDSNPTRPDRRTSIRRYVGLFSKDLATSVNQTSTEAATTSYAGIQDYFDGTNTIVPKASRTEFAEGGSHYLTKSDVPKGLPYDELPPNYPAGSWDCKGTEQEVEHTMLLANRKICSVSYNYPRICETPTRVTTNQDTLNPNGSGLRDQGEYDKELAAAKALFP